MFDLFTIEELRLIVWSLADRIKYGPISNSNELFYLSLAYNMFSKALYKKIEKNKQIYINEILEGS